MTTSPTSQRPLKNSGCGGAYENVSMQGLSCFKKNSITSPSITLPLDMLRAHIFCLLPLKDLKQASKVCKAWNKIANELLQCAYDVIKIWEHLYWSTYDVINNSKGFPAPPSDSMIASIIEEEFDKAIEQAEIKKLEIDDSKKIYKFIFISIHAKLCSIPKPITKLIHLCKMNFSYNFIQYIPCEILKLKCLQQINLSHNFIQSIPNELWQLEHIMYLDLSYNNISFIQNDVVNKWGFSFLDLSHNRLTTLPEWMGRSFFKWLNASYNCLTSIPSTICNVVTYFLDLSHNQLTTITTEMICCEEECIGMDFSYNRLSALPEWSRDTILKWLDASHNDLASIPTTISNLSWLNVLYLNNNKLTTFPNACLHLPNLRIISLENNQIQSIPEEIPFSLTPWGSTTLIKGSTVIEIKSNPIRPNEELYYKVMRCFHKYFSTVCYVFSIALAILLIANQIFLKRKHTQGVFSKRFDR